MIMSLLKELIVNVLMKNFFCWFITDKVQDAIKESLVAQDGIGLHYKVIAKKRDIVLITQINGLILPYEIWGDLRERNYYIVRDNIVIFRGQPSYLNRERIQTLEEAPEQVLAEEATAYFLGRRSYTKALEIAALGQWTDFRNYVDYNWKTILEEMCD